MTPTETALTSVHTTEYSSLRTEINAFHATEGQIMNFSIALSGALIAFAARSEGIKSPYLLLFAPLPFFLLGTFFGYTQIRIIQVASYLNNDLRPKVIAVLGRDDLWRWEFFRRGNGSCECPVRSGATVLGAMRWFLFLWPVGLLIYLLLTSKRETRILVWVSLDFLFFLALVAFAAYCTLKLPSKVLECIEPRARDI